MRRTVNVEQLFRSAATQAVSFERGATLFAEGDAPDAVFIVITGRVVLSQQTEGRQKILGVLREGDFAGAAAGITGASHIATARAVDETTVVRLPATEALSMIAGSPDYAAALIRQFAFEAARNGEPAFERDSDAAQPAGVYDQNLFYATERTCPVRDTSFVSLSVRSKAINSVRRDSDFHYWYKGVNPAHYAVVACAQCRYAALAEEFEGVQPRERSKVLSAGRGRQDFAGKRDLSGERDDGAVRLSLELAIKTHETRGASLRKRGGLYHRIAWLAREQGDEATEHEFLRRAYDDYESTFENDSISDAAAVNLAYLMADVSLRLGNHEAAVRWFDAVTRMPESRNHPEILRLTRQQWSDLRQQRSKPA